jgi:hypothetical protein
VASFSSVTIISGLGAAVHAFDSAFIAADFGCATGPAIGDYIQMGCQRGTANTYGWEAVAQVSTGSVVAAMRVDSNIQTRWCGIHNVYKAGYAAPVLGITTHQMDGQMGGGPPLVVARISAPTAVEVRSQSVQPQSR